MSFFKKKSSATPKTGASGDIVTDSELSALEKETASFDFSPDAIAKRAAAKAALITLPLDEYESSSSSSSSHPASMGGGGRTRLIPYSVPDGTYPAVTWPGEILVNEIGEVSHTEHAELRELFVRTPPVFSRYDDKTPIRELNIAPAVFAIDLLENPQPLCAQMNAHAGAPTLDHLYDKATVHTAPRFFCKWPVRPGAAPIKRPTNEQMVRSSMRFVLPLAASATALDVHAYLASLPLSYQKSIPLALGPRAFEQNSIVRFTDGGGAKDRKLQWIPVRFTIVEMHNTLGIPLELELRAPNVGRKSDNGVLFTTASDTVGMSSCGPTFASSCKDRLNTVCAFNSYAFNSPEAARWLTIADREQEEKNFEANLHGDFSDVVGLEEHKMIFIRLTPEPKTLAQYIAVSFPGHLAVACANGGMVPPIMNTQAVGKDETAPFGHVAVRLDALVAVFRHFCDLYNPCNFAINNHKLVLHASPSNQEGTALHALRTIGQRNPTTSAQLEVTLEVILLPYEGPQRLADKDKALLKQIDEDHSVLEAKANSFRRAAIASSSPPSKAVMARNQSDLASVSVPFYSAGAGIAIPAESPFTGHGRRIKASSSSAGPPSF